MNEDIKKGLLGIVVDETTISQVMPDINSLTYRGYAVQDLCEKCNFEEVAYLVLNGELPNKNELKKFKNQLEKNTMHFRKEIKNIGFEIKGDNHPIIPIMIYDAKKALMMSEELLKRNIYVIAFSFPVVPENEARIRVQISASHSEEQINKALHAFKDVGKELKII